MSTQTASSIEIEAFEPHPGWARQGRQPRIAIIGAGMSGIAAVVKLRRAGYTDLTVFEKADRVGGTWRENHYPGLSCDVPSYWYSFTFAKNPDWSHRFAYGPEIQAYMERTARDFGVLDVTHFDTPVTELRYEAPTWRLTTGRGDEHVFDVVISATGVLHHPAFPDIPGLDSFEGEAFHSARWNDDLDLAGKRVGIIGTGSTAAQIVGEIGPEVGRMSVFQRTPQWMAPLPQKAYSKAWKRFLRLFPFVQTLLYHFYYWYMTSRVGGAVLGDEKAHARLAEACRRNLAENVHDPELRARLTPDYKAACKRIVVASDFYPAICADNAELVTDAIERIEPGGVRTKDGRLHELDVLVLATGFDPTRFILPTKVTGENGVDLEKRWDDAPRAHRSMSVPGFPNLWMIEGPTGPVGNLSLITISEYQLGYVIQCLDKMKRDGLEAIAAREEAFDAYNAYLREGLKKTIWVTGGCHSWYIDKTGMPNLYPYAPQQFRKEMQRPDFSEYRLIHEV
ncbi:MAG: NAD(P)/FAD-dependent oxidoreductase [Myxococcota bacterium]|nr:NAD(P)/FAD-dependent oxidoreductase [Myxococcales bacterium]